MRTNCSKCNKSIKINGSQINQKIWKFFDKTGLYMCKVCRQKAKVYLDAEATIKELKKIKNGK